MINLSTFLGKVWGFYLLITGVTILFRQKMMRRYVQEFVKDRLTAFFLGFFIIIIGLLMVLSHNIWELNYKVIITIFGWLTLAKGIMFIMFPRALFRMAKWLLTPKFFIGWAIVGISIGLYLLNRAFAWF